MSSQHVIGRTFSRRLALRGGAVASVGLASAALIGCTAGRDKPPAPAAADAAPSKVTAPERGGTLRLQEIGDTDSFDPLTAAAATGQARAGYTYSRLMQWKAGDGERAKGDMEGDLSDKWEQPDPLTYVFHLRKGVAWDQRAPTNGRALTAEDVQKSWEKFAAKGKYRADVANAANKASSVVSLTAVDSSTVKMTLAFPDSEALETLNWPNNFWVMPLESMNGGFDPVKEMRGTGPFLQTEYRPAVGFKYVRNPKWYGGPDRPYLDGIDIAIIPQAAQVEAQFRAGNLHIGNQLGNPTNIPVVAREVPGAAIQLLAPEGAGTSLCFNWQPKSPFKDVRVRRAMSMALDRDTFIDVNYDPAAYEKLGVRLNRYWNTPTTAAYGDSWLDPKGKDFGPAAGHLKYNIAEARQLLAAAGFNDSKPLEYDIIFPGNRHDPNRIGQVETWRAMSAKAGIKVFSRSVDYSTDWLKLYTDARGYFDFRDGRSGVLYKPNGGRPTAGGWYALFFAAKGSISIVGDEFPELEKMVQDQRRILNRAERLKKEHDIQRYAVENMVCCPVGANVDYTDVYWKGVHGPERYHGWPGAGGSAARPTEIMTHYWMDKSLRT